MQRLQRRFRFFSILFLMLLAYLPKAQKAFDFPNDWIGVWADTLRIYGVDSVRMAVPMQLEIQAIDSSKNHFTWGITYGDKSSDWRPYELLPKDIEKGVWVIDEKNNIIIESYVRGNAFTSWFVVEKSRVLCIYERTEAGLAFRVVAGKENPVSTTGSGTHEGEEISAVDTYPATTFQFALLKKQ